MRRSALSLALAVILAFAAAASASGASSFPPRGVLTNAEYQELLSAQRDLAAGHAHGSDLEIARHLCRSLTRVSRLLSTQRADCIADVIFWDNYLGFQGAVQQCNRGDAKLIVLRCLARTVQRFYTATRGYLRADNAAHRAAAARGIVGRCLDDLVFTPPQLTAMRRIGASLRRFGQALRVLNVKALATATVKLDSAISAGAKVLMVGASVTVCRHE